MIVNTLAGVSVRWIMGRSPWPVDDGWRMRSSALVECVRDSGAEIDIFAFGDPAEADAHAKKYGVRSIRYIKRSSQYSTGALIRGVIGTTPFSVLNYGDKEFEKVVAMASEARDYAVTIAEDIVMAQYLSNCGGLSVLDMHNIESQLMLRYAADEARIARKVYARVTASKLERYEAGISRRVSLVTVPSEQDQSCLLGMAPGARTLVIPNGIRRMEQLGYGLSDANKVLFVGNLAYHANISGIKWFCNDVLPMLLKKRPNVVIEIVGKDPGEDVMKLASPHVRIIGNVPSIIPYMETAAVTIAPLLVGGGTRLKILEAMMLGRAVISTAIGCEGLDVADGEHLVIADKPKDFVAAIDSLLGDSERRQAMQLRAHEQVTRFYTWGHVSQPLVKFISSHFTEKV